MRMNDGASLIDWTRRETNNDTIIAAINAKNALDTLASVWSASRVPGVIAFTDAQTAARRMDSVMPFWTRGTPAKAPPPAENEESWESYTAGTDTTGTTYTAAAAAASPTVDTAYTAPLPSTAPPQTVSPEEGQRIEDIMNRYFQKQVKEAYRYAKAQSTAATRTTGKSRSRGGESTGAASIAPDGSSNKRSRRRGKSDGDTTKRSRRESSGTSSRRETGGSTAGTETA